MSPAPRGRPSIKSLVSDYLAAERPKRIHAAELDALADYVRKTLDREKPVSRSYLLHLLGDTETPISRSLGGLPPGLRHRVHFRDPGQAAASLLDLQDEYALARRNGDKTRAADCRRAVLLAKDRLKQHLRRRNLSEAQQREKQELLAWFLTWLENPGLFRDWLAIRQERSRGKPEENQES